MGFLSVALGKWCFLGSCGTTRFTQVHLVSRILTKAKAGLECHWKASARLTIKVCPSCALETKAELRQQGQEPRSKRAARLVRCILLPQEFRVHTPLLWAQMLLPDPRVPPTEEMQVYRSRNSREARSLAFCVCNSQEVLGILAVYSEVTGKYITPIS